MAVASQSARCRRLDGKPAESVPSGARIGAVKFGFGAAAHGRCTHDI